MTEFGCPDHEKLVSNLLQPARYPHRVESVRLIETHISSILLTGEVAYKLKKPLALGFLDFSTLAKRHGCCLEEVRLNVRLAPEIYLGVVPIFGSVADPRFDGPGEAIEYAVKMREFPQSALLDAMLAAGDLDSGIIDRLAAAVADFHGSADRAPLGAVYGSPERATSLALDNFGDIAARLAGAEQRGPLERLRNWTLAAAAALAAAFAERKRDGFVRECHGDLHLGNIAWIDGRVQVFDGIEFNAELRWIDVASDVAFLFMDLAVRGHPEFAWRFLNAYLERCGDYGAMRVLEFYLVYRALVRAKVALIRSSQDHLPPAIRASALASFHSYLAFAGTWVTSRQPKLILTHGLSGSGKTAIAQALLEQIGAVRLRADVERKRLHHLPHAGRTFSPVAGGIYSDAATRGTYQRLIDQARTIIEAGYPVILDGSFLARWQRDQARDLAHSAHTPFLILDCQAPVDVLRTRVVVRERAGADASEATEAVLAHQMEIAEPLGQDESPRVVSFDSANEPAGIAAVRLSKMLRASESAVN
jgi:uncharacterized protein